MGEILETRLQTRRALPVGEQVLLALGIAAGELGSLVERILRRRGLTSTRYNVLRILRGAGGPLSCADLGHRLLVSSPDVTRLVDPLVERGWVERDRLARDRRVVVQSLTPGGAALLAELDLPLGRLYEAVAAALGEDDAISLAASCEQVIELVHEGGLDEAVEEVATGPGAR